jgi:hypothetical protein
MILCAAYGWSNDRKYLSRLDLRIPVACLGRVEGLYRNKG